MRDVVKKVLADWLVELSQREGKMRVFLDTADSDIRGDEELDRLLWIERHLMGVALFLADVAEQANDMELLGIARRARKISQNKIDEDEKIAEEHTGYDLCLMAGLDAARAFFASIPSSVIDMSPYRQAVEEARPFFSNPRDYLDLLKYTDERKVLKRIKSQVKEAVCDCVRNNKGQTPPPEWIRDKFDFALRDTYRRADQYVPMKLKRFAPQSLIPPIGADAPPSA